MPGQDDTGPVAVQTTSGDNYAGRSRMLWTFSDQALSSLTNAALSIVVARAVAPGVFGSFALALLTYGFVVGLVRAFVGEPYMVRFSAANASERRRGTAWATGAALVMGVAAGLVCLVVALVASLFSGSAAAAFTALAISLPGLVLQDTWRHLFFAAGRPASATMNDLTWAVLQFGALGFLFLTGKPSVFVITLAWGLSALVGAILGWQQTGVAPSPRRAKAWVQETKDLSYPLGLGYAINTGAVNAVTYLIGFIVGVVAVGAMRAAQTLLGPLNLLFAGFNAFILPLMSRAAVRGERLLRLAILCSAALSTITAIWVTALVVLPDSIGVKILKDNWDGAAKVMLPSGLVLLAGAAVLGASSALVSLGRSDLMLRITRIQAPLMLVLGLAGAWAGGVVLGVYGLAAAQTMGLVYCWVLLLKADGDPRRGLADPEPA
ncbi:MATE family efflux transporter [Kineosporia succinea]|uniref:O-antigen/teichoic acid export membrane protein n=1 Tax=Kineosporia succinea TaxID=84632 RepID=A0ABT9P1K2_9ACTN|nr:hypothetical protein [Kineosporia succinea]MDP9825965.1 O-antigen/teichoic acid export membrane protein [Kineosporia succinea]